MLFIPQSSFVPNRVGQPVLPKGHKALITHCMRLRTPPWILLSDVGAIPSSTISPNSITLSSTPVGSDSWPSPAESRTQPKSFRDDPTPHLSYLRYLQRNQPSKSQIEIFGAGYQDYLQAPLQPLADNLESITYEVFEKDPIKYEWYERAIFHALKDWDSEGKPTSSDTGAVVIAVAGSGRGPLVTRALRAAQLADVPVEVWAVEKNPNAYVLLQRKNEEEWNRQVRVVKTDMRAWKGPLLPDGTHGHVDVVVSELLGSFADNELSPECLDGVQHVLNPEYGISIPASYTAHLTPIATPKLYADILGKSNADPSVFEVPYVVMLHAHDFLATVPSPESDLDSSDGKREPSVEAPSELMPLNTPDVQICWEFSHPAPALILAQSNLRRGGNALGGWGGALGGDGANEHNERSVVLNFKCPNRGTCHGLAGYFETVLYEGDETSTVELSTNPVTMDEKSKNMISWFPIFFPLKVCCISSLILRCSGYEQICPQLMHC
jgi:type II protein arginine methyltransferase